MRTRIIRICVLFFVSVAVRAQVQHSVEFMGGVNYPDPGSNTVGAPSAAITAGVGASMLLSPRIEIIGSTLFTYFPVPEYRSGLMPASPYDLYPSYEPDQNQYSVELTIGLRSHGQGTAFIHPFLGIEGGARLLRSTVGASDARTYAIPATTQFLNIQGTEDVHLLGLINAVGGVQLRPDASVWFNLEVKYQLLIGGNSSVTTWVPILVSLQLPV